MPSSIVGRQESHQVLRGERQELQRPIRHFQNAGLRHLHLQRHDESKNDRL